MADKSGNVEAIAVKLAAWPAADEHDRKMDPILRELTFDLTVGCRCVCVGLNGAGKSTLLRMLAGRYYVSEDSVRVLGLSPYYDTILNGHIAHIAERWTLKLGAVVADLLATIPGGAPPERLEKLVRMLNVNRRWHFNRLSDGEKRRVQAVMALAVPKDVYLLDEVTSDLDVVHRRRLLDFLKGESTERGATVVLATHIFDGLEDWPTHVLRLTAGTASFFGPLDQCSDYQRISAGASSTPLQDTIEAWQRLELAEYKANPDRFTRMVRKQNYADLQLFTGGSRSENIPGMKPHWHQGMEERYADEMVPAKGQEP